MDPSVGELLGELVPDVERALGGDLVGLYLYGSAVSGGFEPGVSDVDLVAVTRPPADALDVPALGALHVGLAARLPAWDDRVEVVYVGRRALADFRTTPERLAVISPGEPFHLRDERIVEWLQNWYLVREGSVTLVGPEPASLVPPIAWSEFLAATARYAEQLRAMDVTALSAGALSYVVLTMARALTTLRTGTHPSKAEAAAWVANQMPDWAGLMAEALDVRRTRGRVGLTSEQMRKAAARFLRSADIDPVRE